MVYKLYNLVFNSYTLTVYTHKADKKFIAIGSSRKIMLNEVLVIRLVNSYSSEMPHSNHNY